MREVRGNVTSRELTMGVFSFLKLAEAVRGRPEEDLCVVFDGEDEVEKRVSMNLP